MQFVSVTSQVSFLSTSFHKKVKKYKEKPHLSKGKESTYLFGQSAIILLNENFIEEKDYKIDVGKKKSCFCSCSLFSLYTSSRVSVKRGPDTCGWRMRMADADGKMRIEKCGQHKADGKMLINQKTKNKTRKCRQQKRKKLANKHKKKRSLSFKWMSYGWALHVQNTLSLVGTSYPRFFSLFFETCKAFH